MRRELTAIICSIAFTLTLCGASIWEGNAVVAAPSDFSEIGNFGASNSFSPNSTVEITNAENGKTILVKITKTVDNPSIFIALSSSAARALGIPDGGSVRVRAIDRTIAQNDSNILPAIIAENTDPDYNPKLYAGREYFKNELSFNNEKAVISELSNEDNYLDGLSLKTKEDVLNANPPDSDKQVLSIDKSKVDSSSFNSQDTNIPKPEIPSKIQAIENSTEDKPELLEIPNISQIKKEGQIYNITEPEINENNLAKYNNENMEATKEQFEILEKNNEVANDPLPKITLAEPENKIEDNALTNIESKDKPISKPQIEKTTEVSAIFNGEKKEESEPNLNSEPKLEEKPKVQAEVVPSNNDLANNNTEDQAEVPSIEDLAKKNTEDQAEVKSIDETKPVSNLDMYETNIQEIGKDNKLSVEEDSLSKADEEIIKSEEPEEVRSELELKPAENYTPPSTVKSDKNVKIENGNLIPTKDPKQNYYVQLGVFSSEESLNQAKNKIGNNFIFIVEKGPGISGKNTWRLLLGPLRKDESGLALVKARALGFTDAFEKSSSYQ